MQQDKPPVYIERNKLSTSVMPQSMGVITDLWKSSPLALAQPSKASIFTSTTPMDIVPKSDVVYECVVRDITTLFDSYLRKTDLVMLLDCAALRQRQAELVALGFESVYRSEEPYVPLVANMPQMSPHIRAFVNGLKDFVARRRGQLYVYLKGEELEGSLGYPFDPDTSVNEQSRSIGKGYVRAPGANLK